MRRVYLGLVFMFVLAGFASPASASAIGFNEAGLVAEARDYAHVKQGRPPPPARVAR